MLIYNPDKRISAEEALAHPYLQKYHDRDNEVGYYQRVHSVIPHGFLQLSSPTPSLSLELEIHRLIIYLSYNFSIGEIKLGLLLKV